MTHEKHTYPQVPGSAEKPQQAGHDWDGQAQDATPLQAAQGLMDESLDALAQTIDQLEKRLQDVLADEDDPDDQNVPQPLALPYRGSHVVRRVQQQENRVHNLDTRLREILNRLEC